jgi:hypothetical protein
MQSWGESWCSTGTLPGQARSVPTAWTSPAAEDPLVVVAAGRSPLPMEDLLALVPRLRDLGGGTEQGGGGVGATGGVEGIAPWVETG